MNLRTGFLMGAGAGLMAGTMMGIVMPCGRNSMKTQVGKSIHRLGVALDKAVDNIIEDIR